MQVGWMSSGFYRTCEWIWKLAYVNLLWLGFTLVGLVLFGFLPATVAMLTIMRKWLQSEDVPIFKTFVITYKNEFLKINALGVVFAVGAYILYFNYMYLGTVTGLTHTVVALGWYVALFVYSITLLFVIPAYVHLELKLFQYIKTALIVALVNPLSVITLFISFFLLFNLFHNVPGLIPFFGPSLIGFVIMWCGHMSFNRIDRKQQKLKET
ncbi:YesL family protein [Evansella sp. AB-rgal1]|uniref:YesL family protein n=1 Tax=Evansella sp. AB-rgal1 TaxID=3242696 RepID=UPI00359D9E3A